MGGNPNARMPFTSSTRPPSNMAAQRDVERLVEGIAIGHEADFQGAIALEGIAAFAEELAHGTARQQADFQGAGDFGDVVGVNPGGRFAVEAAQQAVQRSGAARLAGGEAVAQRLVARRAFEQSIQQSAQVEAGAAGDDREPSARGDFGDRRDGQGGHIRRR